MTRSSTRTGMLTALLAATFTLPSTVSALDFSVNSLNCSALNWSISLTQTEWSVASYVELFFVSPSGANRNYSLLYSALNGGAFPTPGTYSETTTFGNTILSGGYRIGVGLADMNGNLLTMTTGSSTSTGPVQVTSVDPRTFTFTDCGAGSGNGVPGMLSSSSSSVLPTSTSMTLSAATSAPTFSSQAVAASTSTAPTSVALTSTSAAAAPFGSLTSSSTSAIPQHHHGVNKGAIAGGVIGGIFLLLFAFALIRWCSSRRRTRRLSLAAHRMSSVRSESPNEKHSTTVSSRSMDTQRKIYQSSDTLDAAPLGRLSVGSRRRSEGHTPSRDDLSLSNVLAAFPIDQQAQAQQQDVTVVNVPFNLEMPVHPHELAELAAAAPYLPAFALSNDDFHDAAAAYTGRNVSQVSLSKTTPLVLDLDREKSEQATPVTSPTTPTFLRTPRSPHSTSSFKIPRVTVPAYGAGASTGEAGEPLSRQVSRSSGGHRRFSTGGETFVSVDEDPFVDAAQEAGAP